jgi:hypothetical protein
VRRNEGGGFKIGEVDLKIHRLDQEQHVQRMQAEKVSVEDTEAELLILRRAGVETPFHGGVHFASPSFVPLGLEIVRPK